MKTAHVIGIPNAICSTCGMLLRSCSCLAQWQVILMRGKRKGLKVWPQKSFVDAQSKALRLAYLHACDDLPCEVVANISLNTITVSAGYWYQLADLAHNGVFSSEVYKAPNRQKPWVVYIRDEGCVRHKTTFASEANARMNAAQISILCGCAPIMERRNDRILIVDITGWKNAEKILILCGDGK